MISKILKEQCVGCKACGDICPKEAIIFVDDEEGFWYPHINEKLCINCNLCEKTCPVIWDKSQNINDRKPVVLSAYHIDSEIRYNSTSGGVFYGLAEVILDKGGYIIGCAYDDSYTSAYHMASNTLDGLKKIMRSKYFQSNTAGIYNITKELLNQGKEVLFCGTPCQSSALRNYLNKDYKKLYIVDFICRGINTPLAFKAYMKELTQKYRSEIQEVHFKNKSHGWLNLGTKVTFKNGKKYYRNKANDPWVNAFVVGNLYMRPSCHNCRYKKFPRVSDISLGDFWGLKFSKEEVKYGVSVVLINNSKGQEIFEKASTNLKFEKRALDMAIKGNSALINSAPMGVGRKEFFERIKTENYSKVVWDILGKKWPKWRMEGLKHDIKTLIKHFYK